MAAPSLPWSRGAQLTTREDASYLSAGEKRLLRKASLAEKRAQREQARADASPAGCGLSLEDIYHHLLRRRALYAPSMTTPSMGNDGRKRVKHLARLLCWTVDEHGGGARRTMTLLPMKRGDGDGGDDARLPDEQQLAAAAGLMTDWRQQLGNTQSASLIARGAARRNAGRSDVYSSADAAAAGETVLRGVAPRRAQARPSPVDGAEAAVAVPGGEGGGADHIDSSGEGSVAAIIAETASGEASEGSDSGDTDDTDDVSDSDSSTEFTITRLAAMRVSSQAASTHARAAATAAVIESEGRATAAAVAQRRPPQRQLQRRPAHRHLCQERESGLYLLPLPHAPASLLLF